MKRLKIGQNAKNVGAVHTHTHTHTHSFKRIEANIYFTNVDKEEKQFIRKMLFNSFFNKLFFVWERKEGE